jgi:glycerate 2-kinase
VKAPKKIVIAPDKFKGSLSAAEVCSIVSEVFLKYNIATEIVSLPLADGGEGFSQAIIGQKAAKKIEVSVADPLFRPIAGYYYLLENQTAIIEMSVASGLQLLAAHEQNPLYTSTFGTGQLLAHALANKAKTIIIGIGGSATNDAGIGMAAALGYQFLDKNNKIVQPIAANLNHIENIIQPLQKPWQNTKIHVACDVDNPLYGSQGAAYVFGPQKGANTLVVKELDQGLMHIAAIVKQQLGSSNQLSPGAGAAGGLGFGLLSFTNALLQLGIDIILAANNFDKHIENADLIITGEGKIDEQTLQGKVVAGVSKKAQALGIPVWALCGQLDLSVVAYQAIGITSVLEIMQQAKNKDDAKANAAKYLTQLLVKNLSQ